MKLASIDVGSYSIRLSVAELDGGLRLIHEEGVITALATDLKESGLLREDRMEESLQVIKSFVEKAKSLGAERIKIVGTEALRRAKNSSEFIEKLKSLTGIELKVIAPEEEGRYAFLSVAYSLRPQGRFCIIDQGGGSTEFVCGRGFQVESLRSLPFGIVNLTEEFIHSDPPKLYELESLKNFLDEQIKEVVEPCDQLIGLGGTITTIAAIEYGIYPYKGEEVHGKELSIDKIMFWIETLSSMREKDRIANFPHIEPKRAKVIIPGLLIFYRSMLLFGKDKIKVSDWGLKEGLLVEEVIKK
ncbi:MAG: Ppx/GppA phosphatase family protein [Aquificota bacterium]|jgi:exopolyphosphatase/guanosine-5'-triphosphate,3'-diphosphate pyrophosphatase|nr:Ppx/GppA phosphatase family protein [Aquificaceae bacterium]MDM7266838.1 Ppx/GppA phosphatase family protein [Aquificaceae bacterium]HCO39339.1 Ppx/GppA family phosphatase [Aquificaceae bacterium]